MSAITDPGKALEKFGREVEIRFAPSVIGSAGEKWWVCTRYGSPVRWGYGSTLARAVEAMLGLDDPAAPNGGMRE